MAKLTIVCDIKRIPLELVINGDHHELYIHQYSVKDTTELSNLISDYITRNNVDFAAGHFTMADVAALSRLRVIKAVKDSNGDYFFKDLDSLNELGEDGVNQLVNEVLKLNPVPTDDDTLEKKKENS